MSKKTFALIGNQNCGKTTLFNVRNYMLTIFKIQQEFCKNQILLSVTFFWYICE